LNIYNTLSIILAAFIYLHLARQIRKGSAEQNLATWISWALLDVVAGVSLFVQGGNWYLLTIYVAGCTLITCCIIGSAKFTWKAVETICFLLVIASIVVWTQTSARYATIISTAGVVIATYPQLKDALTKPSTIPIDVFVGFIVVNGLAIVGGKAWTIEDRFYPTVCMVLCVLIVGFSLRKYFVKKPAGA